RHAPMFGITPLPNPPAQAGRRERTAYVAPRDAHLTHGKTFDLHSPLPALRAARSADRHHARVLLLAGDPGGMAVVSATGRLRPIHCIHLVRQLSRPVQPTGLLPHDRYYTGVLRRGCAALALLRAVAC